MSIIGRQVVWCNDVFGRAYRLLPKLAGALVVAAPSAWGQPAADAKKFDADNFKPTETVFTKGNMDNLCPNWIQPRVVDRHLLAKFIAEAVVKLPPSVLRHATVDNVPSGLPIPASNYIRYISSQEPFGPNNASTPKELREAADTQLKLRSRLHGWFTNQLKEQARESREQFQDYEVVVNGSDATPIYFRQFFGENSPITIRCHEKLPAGSTQGEGEAAITRATKEALEKISKVILVRKSVEDIPVESSKLKKANAALFSYTDDQLGNSTSFSVEGLVGVTIAGTGADRVEGMRNARSPVKGHADEQGEPGERAYYWYKLVPYVYHKRFDKSPGRTAKDLDILQPGLTGTVTWVSPKGDFAFDLLSDLSHTADRIQNSSVYNASMSFSPSFQIGDVTIFQAPLFVGPLGFRPNLSFVAKQYIIEEHGTNPELKGRESFTGYGLDSELKIFFKDSIGLLSNFEVRLAYSYMANTGSVVDLERFEAGLVFTPFGTENLTIELQYVDGRDKKTLQDEQRWTAGLGLRF
jgi:hypothetical protein